MKDKKVEMVFALQKLRWEQRTMVNLLGAEPEFRTFSCSPPSHLGREAFVSVPPVKKQAQRSKVTWSAERSKYLKGPRQAHKNVTGALLRRLHGVGEVKQGA